MSLNESVVEDAALEWFGELGYAVGHGPQLAPAGPGSAGGMGGFVLANGSMSSNQSGDCPRGAHSNTRSTNSQSLGRQCVARRASPKPEAKLHGLGRKRDICRALIKAIVEHFCPAFAPGGVVLYIGDTENKFVHLEAAGLAALGVTSDSAAKLPDVIVHHKAKKRLLLFEAVIHAGPVDDKRREELKDLFAGCKAHLVFVTALENRRTMQTFGSHIAWESEVWIAEDPDHMIHFNGGRFLGPYPDVIPAKP